MAALNSPKTSLHSADLITILAQAHPGIAFTPGKHFLWSPKDRTVYFVAEKISTNKGIWSLYHELSHALLGHSDFTNDFELLTLEVAAWEEARQQAQKYGHTIDETFMQDCLDTYRDWLHGRSTCPTCGNTGLQQDGHTYHCHNCGGRWTVSQSRFCRMYRRKVQSLQQKTSPHQGGTMFH